MNCPFCFGEGRYASPMTNWDSVPCDRCDGTGTTEQSVEAAS